MTGGLSRATAVSQGGTDIEQESAQKVHSGQKNSPDAPAQTQTLNLLITSPTLYQQAIPAMPMSKDPDPILV